ncbi:META domain-containing protein [Streptomyces fodineus]|uniref:META domain-containing protein n=1 Tax=Streptomyces fodineus TaxID=1904616 RepID=A0A1D7YCU2_9ACTN|nr:META domain-containing protein [Streptomyces fodineus]AOR33437.1 META domain-containing protein [Streptomyces fodineus]
MKRHKQRMISTMVGILAALTVACGSGKADSGAVAVPQPVTGIDWRIDSLTVGGTTRHAPAVARLRIDEDGKAAGNLGCNHFSARATVHGDHITFGDLRTTRMACAPDRMEFERALSRALTTGTLVAKADDAKLTLTDGNGDRIHLSRGAPE